MPAAALSSYLDSYPESPFPVDLHLALFSRQERGRFHLTESVTTPHRFDRPAWRTGKQ